MHNTLPELRHAFCTLWNEGAISTTIQILPGICHAYATLHQGTDGTPARFPALVGDDDNILSWPWSYRLCNIASHRPDSSPRGSVSTFLTGHSPTRLRDSPNALSRPPFPSRSPRAALQGVATE